MSSTPTPSRLCLSTVIASAAIFHALDGMAETLHEREVKAEILAATDMVRC